MNILHLKYAVEVEKAGSISKAAKNLYMGQPHLSTALRELEQSIGITIFKRTPKGVSVTKQGSEFLVYAKSILLQIEQMEGMYKKADHSCVKFDICVPRASYISHAFVKFSKQISDTDCIDLNYRETNSLIAIKNVKDYINNLAIIRYQAEYEQYYLNTLKEYELNFTPLWEFEYMALMSKNHPLAGENQIEYSQLLNYTEIIHGDTSVPTLPISHPNTFLHTSPLKKKIAIYERGSQFELLSEVSSAYMWVSPMPHDVLKRFELVQKRCSIAKNKYKDMLIFRSGYQKTKEDNMFISQLNASVKSVSANL